MCLNFLATSHIIPAFFIKEFYNNSFLDSRLFSKKNFILKKNSVCVLRYIFPPFL